ncbi:MAG: hypothetical protein DMD39_06040 [Gemmatimonadetes bacterium]|nr:MAG: hypothetical protein DMD39_06040 [Gemmatimonadota bacterium]
MWSKPVAIMIAASLSVPLSRIDAPEPQSRHVENWRAVARRAVYFGHQSVGADIVDGIEHLNKELALGLRIVQTYEPSAIAHPAFVHFLAGVNQHPLSKNVAMLNVLAARPRADSAIVLLKYCYVDIDRDTDVQALFASYRTAVSQIRSRFPDVTIVHTTVPVTTVESVLKGQVKRLLGRGSVRQDAIARGRYNALVRAAFAGREPLFDIARVEATRSDGSRAGFVINGQTIETLAPENTRDGGHLNTRGQRIVASELLNVLAGAIRD